MDEEDRLEYIAMRTSANVTLRVPATPDTYEQTAAELLELDLTNSTADEYNQRAGALRRWYAYLKEHDLRPLPWTEAVETYRAALKTARAEAGVDELGDYVTNLEEMSELTAEEQDERWGEYYAAIRKTYRVTFDVLERRGFVLYPGFDSTRTKLGEAPIEEYAIAAFNTLPPPFEADRDASERLGLVSAPAAMRLSTDRAFREVSMFLAGQRDAGEPDQDGFYRLDTGESRGHSATVFIRSGASEIVDPESLGEVLEHIQNERNEAKAKVFIGTIALGIQPGIDPTSFHVAADDLMLMTHGYERTGPNKTNAAYYWKGMAESVTYLFRDLPYTEVGMIVQLPHKESKSYKPQPLMNRPQPIIPLENRHMFKGHLLRRIYELSLPVKGGATETTEQRRKELANLLKALDIESFELGFPLEIIDAFNMTTGRGAPNALIEAPREVLKLKGPSFWLAWEVLFLTRWSKGKPSPDIGKDLLNSLEKLGYLGKSQGRTGQRVSYTVALRKWLADLDALTDMGLLDEPGAEIYEYTSGRWVNRTKDLRLWVNDRGTRITENKLEGLRIVYEIAKHRLAVLEASKAKAEGHRRRRVANKRKKGRG